MQKLVIDRVTIEGIPTLTIHPDQPEKSPVIFYAHGLGGDKDARFDLGCLLARAGFFFVGFDAPMHGERFDKKIMEMLNGQHLTYPKETQLDFVYLVMQLVKQNAQDMHTLITHFTADTAVDAERIGMIGTSLGGCTTYYLAANDPRVKVAVPMLASPFFTKTWIDALTENYALEKWTKELDAQTTETERITQYIQSMDPAVKLMKAYAPKPLLIMGGEKDTTVPKTYLIEAYRKLRPLYASNPEQLRLRIFKGMEHSSNMQMFTLACRWFEKHL